MLHYPDPLIHRKIYPTIIIYGNCLQPKMQVFVLFLNNSSRMKLQCLQKAEGEEAIYQTGPWGKSCVVASFGPPHLSESQLFLSICSILLLISVDDNPALQLGATPSHIPHSTLVTLPSQYVCNSNFLERCECSYLELGMSWSAFVC